MKSPGRYARAASAASAAVWLISLSGTAALAAEPDVAAPVYNLFTAEEETTIGAALARDFEASHELVLNALLTRYLGDLMARLGKASRRPELAFTCRAVYSADVNAYSLPGGAVYVSTGMLEYVQDESELAAVLAHEIGHIAGRHVLNRLSLELRSRSLWEKAKAVLPLLDDKRLEGGFQTLGVPIAALAARQYDRGNEKDADLLAVYNVTRAGWNPAGEVRALERLQSTGESSVGILAAMLATHPNPADRSKAAAAEIRSMTLPPSLEDNSLSFRAMKLGLGLLAKPGKDGR